MGSVMTIASTAMARIVPPQGSPIDRAIPTATISNLAGTKHIKMAGRPTFLNSLKSRLRPLLVKATTKAIWRRIFEIA